MRILICNQRFLFRFGVDRVLLMLGYYWKQAGHEIIMMGNRVDQKVAEKCSDRFIKIPEAEDYFLSNEFTYDYIVKYWDDWFDNNEIPDVVFVAGWPFYTAIKFLKKKCGVCIFQDHGAVPVDGMTGESLRIQNKLRQLRKANLRYASKVIAVSHFLEESQSKVDTDYMIPTGCVYNGVDHINSGLWQQSIVSSDDRDVIRELNAFKEDGYRILFLPGRWEKGNYKRSEDSFIIAEKLLEKGQKFKILVLAHREDVNNLPDELEDCFFFLGFVDDYTLKCVMELSDVGFSPTRWEGFDLPLGEMQFLGRNMYVLNVGAHPEVVCDPYFLCSDIDEIAEKINSELCGRLPVAKNDLECEREYFKHIFTWQKSAYQLMFEIDILISEAKKLPVAITEKLREYFSHWEGKRVITVSNYYPPIFIGGAEIIAHNQGKTMNEENLARVLAFSVQVEDSDSYGNLTLEEFEGIPVVRISVTGDRFDSDGINFFDKKVNKAFEELCKLIHPEVVHCHNIIGTSLGIVDVAKRFGAKVCITLHDFWGICYKNTMSDNSGDLCTNFLACEKCKSCLTKEGINIPIGVRKAYFRRTFEKIDAYISPSQYLADTYIRAGVDCHKMIVLWNGIDVDRFVLLNKIPSVKIRITTVAYFGKHKGIETLLRAIAILNRIDVILNLVGDGVEKENYKNLATELGILQQLRFWGRIPNTEIDKAYAETDIYCLPSVWPENQPVSITEAMASGIPVVASKLGGNEELVQDGVTGLFFKAGDAADLANKLEFLIENEAARSEYGKAGREAICQNTYKNRVNKLMGIYNVLSENNSATKKIIAVKGYQLPWRIDKVTSHDVLLWEWISREEWKNVVAVLLLKNSKLCKEELKQLKDFSIPVFCYEDDSKKYKALGLNLLAYKNNTDIFRLMDKYS